MAKRHTEEQIIGVLKESPRRSLRNSDWMPMEGRFAFGRRGSK